MIEERRLLGVFPVYAAAPAAVSFLSNLVVYYGTLPLISLFPARGLALPIDADIPLCSAFLIFYILFFPFWIFGYMLAGLMGRERFYRFCAADHLARLVCLLFFIFMPVTIARPEITGAGLFDRALAAMYVTDPPCNLFPSVHCCVTALVGVALCHKSCPIPAWAKWSSAALAALIVYSTLAVKQHFFADAAAGVALAAICFAVCSRGSLWRVPERLFTRLNRRMGAE